MKPKGLPRPKLYQMDIRSERLLEISTNMTFIGDEGSGSGDIDSRKNSTSFRLQLAIPTNVILNIPHEEVEELDHWPSGVTEMRPTLLRPALGGISSSFVLMYEHCILRLRTPGSLISVRAEP